MRFIDEIKTFAIRARAQFSWSDLRWSYVIIGGLLLLCIPISMLLEHGSQIWPVVPVLGMMIVVNESVERNGQGVPPFQVYAFFAMIIGVWMLGVIILSTINVLVQLLAVGVLAYYSVKAYMLQRNRLRLIETRRNEGCCIHCGEPADPEELICEECGLEVDPERSSQQRTASIAIYGRKGDRARKVLKQDSMAGTAARKEQSLIANSPIRRGRPPKRK